MPQPSTQLFRQEALKHYLRAEEGRGVARVSPPWSWALLLIVMLFVLTALGFAVVGRVEVNGRGRGMLRPGSVRNLVAQTGGTVVEVVVQSGEAVRAGGRMMRIDSASMQSQMLEAQRQVDTLRTDFAPFAERQDRTYEEQLAQLKSRLVMLEEQVGSQADSLPVHERKWKANQVLEKDGLVSAITVDEAREALSQAQRQLNGNRQTLLQARQEWASLLGRREDELWQRKHSRHTAQAKVDALGINLGLGTLLAPEDGTVEAVLVKPGDVVQVGQVVGRLVPKGEPLQVVAFLPEKDRAFVRVGDEARLELDQLPYSEFGTLKARVLRIGDDLAGPQELQEGLGHTAKTEFPVYRVELQVLDGGAAMEAGTRLRTGMLLNARFVLRKQSPITLVLDPLKRWLH